MEAQARNQALQEQLGVQRQLLRELEHKLHDSQRSNSELRQQVPYTHRPTPHVASYTADLSIKYLNLNSRTHSAKDDALCISVPWLSLLLVMLYGIGEVRFHDLLIVSGVEFLSLNRGQGLFPWSLFILK